MFHREKWHISFHPLTAPGATAASQADQWKSPGQTGAVWRIPNRSDSSGPNPFNWTCSSQKYLRPNNHHPKQQLSPPVLPSDWLSALPSLCRCPVPVLAGRAAEPSAPGENSAATRRPTRCRLVKGMGITATQVAQSFLSSWCFILQVMVQKPRKLQRGWGIQTHNFHRLEPFGSTCRHGITLLPGGMRTLRDHHRFVTCKLWLLGVTSWDPESGHLELFYGTCGRPLLRIYLTGDKEWPSTANSGDK